MKPRLITELDVDPVIPLTEARDHLRITGDDDSPTVYSDDTLVEAMLGAAREWVEGYTGLALTPRTLELSLDAFPADEIFLETAPIAGITWVKYYDGDGVLQTLDTSAYVLDDKQEPGWLLPASGTTWPTTQDVVNAVTIRFTAGYSAVGDSPQTRPLPKALRAAILLILGSLYENRENDTTARVEPVSMGAQALCDFYRVRRGFA